MPRHLGPPGPGERWVDVDLSDQVARAMVGNDVYHTALVTTGKDGWETPVGTFRIQFRVYDETMTSASIGAEEYYVLDHVLFTQYFTNEGHALHLNYWRPDSVFGNQRTSHGCVGMRYQDAELFWNFVGVGSRVVIHE
jgi:lipoprotein-anchoring transpeptidase ErfK/SrfK